MKREELVDAYEEWLSRYDWEWFGSLTFRGYPRRAKAERLFNQWTSEVRRAEGASDFRVVRVGEVGSAGDNLHFHVLVGGLRPGRSDARTRMRWTRRWFELAGDALIGTFDEERGGIRYVLKSLEPDRDFDIDISLKPEPLANDRKSRKRKKAGRKRKKWLYTDGDNF